MQVFNGVTGLSKQRATVVKPAVSNLSKPLYPRPNYLGALCFNIISISTLSLNPLPDNSKGLFVPIVSSYARDHTEACGAVAL